MRIKPDIGLSFDDVLLVPQFSNIDSRQDVDLGTWAAKGLYLRMPILSANMVSVTETRMAEAMFQLGGLGVLHRFAPEETLNEMMFVAGTKGQFGMSIGVNDADPVGKALRALQLGAALIVIDVAHGFHKKVIDTLARLKQESIGPVMVGNIATAEAARILCDWGADALKVGIGPGSHCTTRIVAGVGVPQITAIAEVAEVADQYNVPVCADGGIRCAGDIVKALAAGADTVMLGYLLAGTDESPGTVFTEGSKQYKYYWGSASKQGKLSAGLELRNIEGVMSEVPYVGPVAKVIEQLLDGVRSGMSYVGARTISELHHKAEFIRVTPNAEHLNRGS